MKKLMVHKTIRQTWAWLIVTIMVVTLAIPTCINAIAGDSTVVLTENSGWLESAYVEWSPVTNATGYSVYYKSATASDSTYVKLDDMLVRKYNTYYRADAVGLSAGSYVMKVVPIISGSESASNAAVTSTLTVLPQTREGFAFSSQSTAKTGSGGYNDNGTVAANAQIIYVTEQNKNTVTASVITSSSGTLTTCSGLGAILTARAKGYDTRPLIIRVIGKVTTFNSDKTGYMQLKSTKNISVEGIGEDATAYGWGVFIRECTNIEVRNLGIMLFADDGISLDTNNNNIWIHNNDIFYGAPGSDADQVKGDGSCDVKAFSNFITVSYNHFWDSGKCSLCGMSDTKEFFVSYHHNWFDHSDSRQPRIRVGTIHIYNNYFDGNSKYGVGVTKGSSAFVENNYFRNCKYPMLSSLQGSDIYGDADGTFSGEAGGMIKSFGNTIIGATRFVDQTYSSTDFDAITTSSRSETVSSSYKTVSGGTTYNNFDTASTMYKYTVDTADSAKAKVEKYAGRINGGDFKWEFNDATDDTLYDVNTALKSAISSYSSKLISIGGNSSGSGQSTTAAQTTQTPTQSTTQAPTQQTTTQAPTQQPTTQPAQTVTKVHNFTTSGKTDSFYTIIGNLSTSKGTITYNGLTLTQCLKMESTTSIKFTADKAGTLTLVFLETAATVNVNGTTYTATNRIVTVPVNAGSVTITKAGICNLYYMSFTTQSSTQSQTVTQAVTQTPTQSTTQAPTQSTTQAPTQATTQAVTQTTTKAPTQTTTQAPTQTSAITKVHNFTTSGKTDSFFTISGNLSTSKGTVSYNGLTLTQCLKLESTTSIKFTAPSAGKLTMVFVEATATIKVNGTTYTASKGIVTVSCNAGAVSITKADTCNLFYMVFTTDGSTQTTTQAVTQSTTQAPSTTQAVTQTPTQATTQTPSSTQAPTSPTQQTGYDASSTGVVTSIRSLSDSQLKTVVYCAPNGTGSGTASSPMSLESALQMSATTNGIAIILKDGTYTYNHQITIPYGNNGSSSAYKVLKAAAGAKVILDFSSETYGDTSTNARGLQIEGNYWYVYGITVTGAADNGIFVAGSNNVIERCILKANRDSGLQISRRNSSLSNISDWPSYNYIINCTSFNNNDPATNENADGFAAKLTCGPGNVFDGCISYCNIDDGWDLYAKSETGSIGIVSIRNCIAFNNGTLTDGTSSSSGDRNGFKLGGSNGAVPTPHKVFNCIAFNNGKDGFTDNGNGGALSITNCTSYNNAAVNFNFYRTNGGIYSNLLTVTANNTDKFVGTIQNAVYANSAKYYYIQPKTAVTSGLKIGTIISAPASSDFLSMTAPSTKSDIDSLYRNSDGTITTGGFLITKSSSSFASLGAKLSVSTGTLTLNVSVN